MSQQSNYRSKRWAARGILAGLFLLTCALMHAIGTQTEASPADRQAPAAPGIVMARSAPTADAATPADESTAPGPRYVIVLIGDGMGFEHLKAASCYAYGRDGQLFIQQFPFAGSSVTTPANKGAIPDSASGNTAIATGVKVNTGVVSMRIPGDGKPIKTILERYADAGRRTGLVTTCGVGDATPAAFGAHAKHRKSYEDIYPDYFTQSRPDIILGGSWKLPEGAAEKAGYRMVRMRDELLAIKPGQVSHVFGDFAPGNFAYEFEYMHRIDTRYDRAPHLSEMARWAVHHLAAGDKGFFLMIEGARIDHAAHRNHLPNTVFEVLEFDNAVREVMRWAVHRDDVLVVVTSDHETGGLEVVESKGVGQFPEVTWSTGGHTKADVPVYAWGSGAAAFQGKMENTDIHDKMLAAPTSEKRDRSGMQRMEALLVTRY